MLSTNVTDPDHLRTYFVAFGQALNIAGLETRLELPRRTLRHWLRDGRRLPEHHLEKVAAWAKWAGYDPEKQYGIPSGLFRAIKKPRRALRSPGH